MLRSKALPQSHVRPAARTFLQLTSLPALALAMTTGSVGCGYKLQLVAPGNKPTPERVQAHHAPVEKTQPLVARKRPMQPQYDRAVASMPEYTKKLVYHEGVRPRWIEGGPSFWYIADTRAGIRYLLVQPNKSKQPSELFHHTKLAQTLTRVTGKAFDAADLDISSFSLTGKDSDPLESRSIELSAEGKRWTCARNGSVCSEVPATSGDKSKLPKNSVHSPDKKWIAYIKDDFNLYIRKAQGGKEVKLTKDGSEKYRYALGLPSPRSMVREGKQDVRGWQQIIWSPNSKKLLVPRVDCRKAGELTLVQSVPTDGSMRPKSYTYSYAIPGETDLCQSMPIVFDVASRRAKEAKSSPIPIRYYGHQNWFVWSKDSRYAYFEEMSRGHTSVTLREIDAQTGSVRDVISETADTMIDWRTTDLDFINDGKEVLWNSERDGYNHLYLYDAKTGKLKQQLTSGKYVVRSVEYVDEKTGQLYFMASGMDPKEDPYQRHLYRVNLDGSNLMLLTPENAEHSIRFSSNHEYFVDNFSRPDLPGTAVLRRTVDGAVVQVVERTDVSDLLATGWQWPEPFRAKARDGETDVYGLMFRPSNFNPHKTYPVIENIYTGPHGFYTPKTFGRAYRDSAQAIAELGFIVVIVDGLGTAKRSKAFHDFAHQNLGDGGLDDHISAIRELAQRYPYMDTNRVGIYGFSAGGYDSARALLTHPDFYKVAVSASGNHEIRIDKASWVESWMGFPLGPQYEANSNITLADRLEGKLMLAHGELDDNVHPASTLKLADALIKANKDFDLLIMPNKHHYLGDDPYFVRRRWDYFVTHLLGQNPPEGYQIHLPKDD